MNTSSAHSIEELLVHGAWLRRLATGLVAADGDADDLVQETWLAALVRWPVRREEARAWLARVIRNQAISRARARASAHHESHVDLHERAEIKRAHGCVIRDLPSITRGHAPAA